MALRLMRLRSRRARPSPDAMTLGEHLGELRRRLLVCVVTYLAAAILAFVFYPHILSFLKAPYCHVVGPRHCGFYVTAPLDGLSLRIKIAGYGGLFLSSPVILWELWRFITPGLHSNEKRYAVPFVSVSLLLFAGGIVVAYLIYPHALQWLGSIGGPTLREIYNPNQYLSLMVALMLIFGVAFEFPVVLVSLELAGVLRPAKLASWRRWAFVLIVLFAAIITPTGDPFSMLALAVPMYIFYEGSILLGKLLRR